MKCFLPMIFLFFPLLIFGQGDDINPGDYGMEWPLNTNFFWQIKTTTEYVRISQHRSAGDNHVYIYSEYMEPEAMCIKKKSSVIFNSNYYSYNSCIKTLFAGVDAYVLTCTFDVKTWGGTTNMFYDVTCFAINDTIYVYETARFWVNVGPGHKLSYDHCSRHRFC